MKQSKDLFTDFDISEELQDNSFIKSLSEQYKTKDLSTKQIQALNDLLGIEEPLKHFKIISLTSVRELYYRTDYHGDYLSDSKLVGFKEKDDFDMDEKVQDAIGTQHGANIQVLKYFYGEVLELPNTKNQFYIAKYYLNEFNFAYNALNKTKFRSIKRKNKFIRLINALINEHYAEAESIYTSLNQRY